MNEVSPNYYAGGSGSPEFLVKGTGFSMIPNDALAAVSYDNALPKQHIGDSVNAFEILRILERGDGFIKFGNGKTTTHSPLYLGVIMSQDRHTIYWENDSGPLQ